MHANSEHKGSLENGNPGWLFSEVGLWFFKALKFLANIIVLNRGNILKHTIIWIYNRKIIVKDWEEIGERVEK